MVEGVVRVSSREAMIVAKAILYNIFGREIEPTLSYSREYSYGEGSRSYTWYVYTFTLPIVMRDITKEHVTRMLEVASGRVRTMKDVIFGGVGWSFRLYPVVKSCPREDFPYSYPCVTLDSEVELEVAYCHGACQGYEPNEISRAFIWKIIEDPEVVITDPYDGSIYVRDKRNDIEMYVGYIRGKTATVKVWKYKPLNEKAFEALESKLTELGYNIVYLAL